MSTKLDVPYDPPSLEELKGLRRKIRNTFIEHKERLSLLERMAMFVGDRVGSAGFFAVLFCWTVLWLGWNTLAPVEMRFDPFPGFVLWLFISNMIQILLMPLIMISQNLYSRHADVRAEADFEINTKAEFEIEVVLQHLENQNEMILEILERLEHKR
jgi:uncharacterized membrane protein